MDISVDGSIKTEQASEPFYTTEAGSLGVVPTSVSNEVFSGRDRVVEATGSTQSTTRGNSTDLFVDVTPKLGSQNISPKVIGYWAEVSGISSIGISQKGSDPKNAYYWDRIQYISQTHPIGLQ